MLEVGYGGYAGAGAGGGADCHEAEDYSGFWIWFWLGHGKLLVFMCGKGILGVV